jgi:chaperonin cofactor prefoldin
MATATTYPSVPIPQDNIDSVYQAVLAMRQTVQLLIVNAQTVTDQTLSKASQTFSKKSDHTDLVNTINTGLTTVNKSITNINQSLETIQNNVTTLQGQVSALTTRVSSLESRVNIAENNIVNLNTSVTDLDTRVAAIEAMTNHDVRVRTISTTLNNAVANNAVLQFDTIDFDSDGFAPTTATFDHVTIPSGLGGVYVFTAWASGSGNQSTTLGMGILVNGVERFPVANQSISGPGSVNYVLSTPAIQTMRLSAGDIVQLVNTSVTGGTNIFTGVTMSLVRIEVP